MSESLLIAQVTDTHIRPSNISYRGVNVRQHFLNVLTVLAKKPLDLMILSGDLASVEGEPESYAWIRLALRDFPHPYVLMAGNHDHVVRMMNAFDMPNSDEVTQGMLYFSRNIKGRQLLFLDSSPYRIAREQLEWLENKFIESNEPALLFVHHPPAFCDCKFMDEHAVLQNIDEVWKTLNRIPQIQHIFCGHYHADKTVIHNDKFIHLTPSTAFQIDTETPHFIIKHTRPGWRIIEWKNKQVHTHVEYL